GRPFTFDLRGSADGVDLRRLPASINAPQLATTLSASEYHVHGDGRSVGGTAALKRSIVEGATFADGTTAEFSVTPATITYGARGRVADLNLERLGRALKVAALATPDYASRISGSFDVKGAVPRVPARRHGAGGEPPPAIRTITVDATGTLEDSELMSGRVP